MQPNKNNGINRFSAKLSVIGFLIGLFILVSLFPFYYQTQTLWYKLGIDRTLLIAGQLAGLYAACLVFIQLVLIARLQFLIRLFGIATLSNMHRFNGKCIPIAVLAHILLVLVPEGIGNLPIGLKYWPEMAGLIVFSLLLFLSISNWIRTRLALPYQQWKTVHKAVGLTSCFGIGVHIIFVSDAFRQTAPTVYFLTLFVTFFSVYLWGKWRQGKHL